MSNLLLNLSLCPCSLKFFLLPSSGYKKNYVVLNSYVNVCLHMIFKCFANALELIRYR